MSPEMLRGFVWGVVFVLAVMVLRRLWRDAKDSGDPERIKRRQARAVLNIAVHTGITGDYALALDLTLCAARVCRAAVPPSYVTSALERIPHGTFLPERVEWYGVEAVRWPDDPRARYKYGVALHDAGRTAEARREWEACRALPQGDGVWGWNAREMLDATEGASEKEASSNGDFDNRG